MASPAPACQRSPDQQEVAGRFGKAAAATSCRCECNVGLLHYKRPFDRSRADRFSVSTHISSSAAEHEHDRRQTDPPALRGPKSRLRATLSTTLAGAVAHGTIGAQRALVAANGRR